VSAAARGDRQWQGTRSGRPQQHGDVGLGVRGYRNRSRCGLGVRPVACRGGVGEKRMLSSMTTDDAPPFAPLLAALETAWSRPWRSRVRTFVCLLLHARLRATRAARSSRLSPVHALLRSVDISMTSCYALWPFFCRKINLVIR
jgi:hypothetical protein